MSLRRATAAAVLLASATGVAAGRSIDVERSTLTVFVYKAGLFSAFADDHVIRAPIVSGTISVDPPRSVAVRVRAGSLTVLDPKLSADKRAEVQARMLGPDVLDVEKYPEIVFESTSIEPAGSNRWTVVGRLTIHGETRSTTVPVAEKNGSYTGSVVLKQRDFGIRPISIAGGTVKVKDEIRIEFDIVPGR